MRASVRAALCQASRHASNIGTFHSRSFHSSRCTFARHDPYKVLGVSKSSSAAEIKTAYYKLAKLHHPDSASNPNIAEFQKAQDAYETLTDPKKKREFEEQSASGFDSNDFDNGFAGYSYGTNGNSQSAGWENMDDEEDFFSFFTSSSRRSKPVRNPIRKGADLQAELKLSFMESIDGCVKPITYHCDEACPKCDNTGKSKVEKKKTCRACSGRGHRTMMGPYGRPRKVQCDTCAGEGKVESLCSACSGTGVKSTERQVEVKIPAGVTAETNLRLAGMGDAGRRGGGSGDLRLTIQIAADASDRFTRNGTDIHANVSIDIGTAILGGKIPVETIRGTETIRLQAPLTNGQTVRIRGGGVQKSNSQPPKFGDHVITLSIHLPSKDQLTPAQQELLQQISQLSVKSSQSSNKSYRTSDETKKSSAQKLSATRRAATSSKKKAAAPEPESEYEEDIEDMFDEDDLFDFDFGEFEPSSHKAQKRQRKASKKRQRWKS